MRKLVLVILVVAAIYLLVTQPQAAADFVKGTGNVIGDVFATIVEFLNALFS